MTFSHLYFALLPDFIPPQYSKSLSQYVPKLIKQQDADRQINGLTSMIDEYNFRLNNLKGSSKRKTRKRIKELTKERLRLKKKRGKDILLSFYVDVSKLQLKLENQEKNFRSVKVKSLQADS